MSNSSVSNIAKLISLAASLLFSGSLSADSYKKISRSIDVDSFESVEIEASIAEMEIEFYDGNEIELEIEIESDGQWLFWRRGDIGEVELQVRSTVDSLYLGIPDKKVEQHWRVKMPANLAIAIEVGVGDIELEGFSNSLQMDLGVGSVRVLIDDTDYAVIRASAGVGDTAIKGFSGRDVDNERTFMSSDSYHYGEGDFEIDIELGVGDAEIRRR